VFELLLSAAVTLLAAPVVLRVMRRRGIIDVPNHRSSHSIPVPRGGGLACLAGATVAIVWFAIDGQSVAWGLAVAVVLLTLVGLADDARSLPALSRLAAQVAAGAGIGWAASGGWWICVGAVVAPIIVNVVNFMDGINGITSLTMAVWGVTALAVGSDRDITALALLGAIAAGSALGFLPWNAPVARLFLGDSGSYLFGGIVAAGVVFGWSSGAPVVPLVAPLTLYLVDTGVVFIKRAHRGDSLFEAHREHVYQRLTSELGLSHLSVALAVAALSASMTVAWLSAVIWVPLVVPALLGGLYLAAPRLLSSRSTAGAAAPRCAE